MPCPLHARVVCGLSVVTLVLSGTLAGCGGAQQRGTVATSSGAAPTSSAAGDVLATEGGRPSPANIIVSGGRFVGLVRTARRPARIATVGVGNDGRQLWREDGVCGKVFRAYPVAGRVVCFNSAVDTAIGVDAASGDVSWRTKLGGRASRTGIRDGLVVAVVGNDEVTLQPLDGKELRRAPFAKSTRSAVRIGGIVVARPRPGITVTRSAGTNAVVRTDLDTWLPGNRSLPGGLAVFGRASGGSLIGLMDAATHKVVWSKPWAGQQSANNAAEANGVITFTGPDHWMAVSAQDGGVLGSGPRARRQPVAASANVIARLDHVAGKGYRMVVAPLKVAAAPKPAPPAAAQSAFFDRGVVMQFMTIAHGGISAKSGLYKKAKAGAIAVTVRKKGKEVTLGWERGNGADTGTIVLTADALKDARKHGDRFQVNVGVVAASDRTSMALSRAVFDEAVKKGRTAWQDIDTPGATELVYVGPTWHAYTLRRHGKGKQPRIMRGHAFRAGSARYVVVESGGIPVVVRANRPGKVLFLAEVVPP